MSNDIDAKLFLQANLNQISLNRIAQKIDQLGKALPCIVTAVSGSFVTVAFEVNAGVQTLPSITIPKAEGPWIRSPTQVGDYGLTVPSDAAISGISGQGGGLANTTRRANLTALVWVPVASTAFSSVNTNQAFVSGPQGVQMQTQDGHSAITVSETGITITVGGKTWTFTSAGLTASDGIVFESHQHTYSPGSGAATQTSGPVA